MLNVNQNLNLIFESHAFQVVDPKGSFDNFNDSKKGNWKALWQ